MTTYKQKQSYMRNKKLIDKLYKLVENRCIHFWNGHQIKKCETSNSLPDVKVFQVNGIKYRLILSVERRCSHEIYFIPTSPTIELTVGESRYSGNVIQGYKNIANYLNLDVKDIIEIYKPLVDDSNYIDEEIQMSKDETNEFIKYFNENFLL